MRIMFFRFSAIAVLLTLALAACQQSGSKNTAVEEPAAEQRPARPYAELYVPTNVDMGVFEGDELVKSVTLQLSNYGTDTLYVLGVEPECDCVKIIDYSPKVAPNVNAHLTVQLDVSEYADTVRKVFGIISNDRLERVKRVTLFGVRK